MNTVKLAFLVGLITLIPFIRSINAPWSAIDDWELIKIYEETQNKFKDSLSSGIRNVFNDPQSGRVRHSYLLLNYLNFRAFGLSSLLHHAYRLSLLLVCSILIFLLTHRFTSDNLAATVSALVFGWFGFASENWVRLGPQEVYLVTFQLLTLYLLFRFLDHRTPSPALKIGLAISSLTALFTKEISFIWLLFPFMIWLMFPGYRKKLNFFLLLNILLVLIVFLLIKLNFSGGSTYGSKYIDFSIQRSITNLSEFGKIYYESLGLYGIVIIFGLILTFLRPGKTRIGYLFSLWIWFFGFIFLQSLWEFPLGRYLLPSCIPLAMIIGISANLIKFNLKNKLYLIPLCIATIVLLLQNLIQLNITQKSLLNRDEGIWESLKYLSKKAESKSSIYTNLSTSPDQVEWWYGLNFLLQNVLHRTDLELNKLPLKNIDNSNNVYVLYWSAPFNRNEQEIYQIFPNLINIFSFNKNIYFKQFTLSDLIIKPHIYFKFTQKIFGEPYSFIWKIYATKL